MEKRNIDTINEVESSYNVEMINYKGFPIWLELRNRFYAKLFYGEESALKITSSTYISILLSLFYGFFNWFRKYETWFIGGTINRIEIDGKYYDRLFDYPASLLKGKSLFIELSRSKYYKRKKVFSKYIVSKYPLLLLEKIYGIFISVNKVNLECLTELEKQYDVKINSSYVVKKIISQYQVMSLLLKFKKPKRVFIAPSYTSYGYVYALKEAGVCVVEIQHGVILEEHYGYSVKSKFDRKFFVDYLLTLGNSEINVFKNGNGISQNSVVPIGSYYLNFLKANFVADSGIKKLVSEFEKSFLVSLQELDFGEKIIPFMIESALSNPNYLFIFKPRRSGVSYYDKFNLPKNIKVITHLNVYQLILQTDFHITLYSTTALEAPALGRQNILINIENKSKDIFGQVLFNDIATKYVDSVDEFNVLVKDIEVHAPKDVMAAHGGVIKAGFEENINDFVNKYL
jgi:hypothetical protein